MMEYATATLRAPEAARVCEPQPQRGRAHARGCDAPSGYHEMYDALRLTELGSRNTVSVRAYGCSLLWSACAPAKYSS